MMMISVMRYLQICTNPYITRIFAIALCTTIHTSERSAHETTKWSAFYYAVSAAIKAAFPSTKLSSKFNSNEETFHAAYKSTKQCTIHAAESTSYFTTLVAASKRPIIRAFLWAVLSTVL